MAADNAFIFLYLLFLPEYKDMKIKEFIKRKMTDICSLQLRSSRLRSLSSRPFAERSRGKPKLYPEPGSNADASLRSFHSVMIFDMTLVSLGNDLRCGQHPDT
jgi:hypothetical protein